MANRTTETRFLAFPASLPLRLAQGAALAVLGTLLLTLSAKMKVSLGIVDISLQTLAVMLLASLLGFRLGVATVVLYIAQGLYGLPVFQSSPEQGAGLPYVLGPTGGYLAGFVAMAAIVGHAADRGWHRSILKFSIALLVAEAAMMAMGFAWLATLIGIEAAWRAGVVPFIVGDLIKTGLAAAIVFAVSRKVWRLGANQ